MRDKRRIQVARAPGARTGAASAGGPIDCPAAPHQHRIDGHAPWRGPSPAQPSPAQPSPAQPSLRRILIVDDDPRILTGLSRLLGCFARIVSFGPVPPGLVFVELAFEDERAIAALDAALARCAPTAVVVMAVGAGLWDPAVIVTPPCGPRVDEPRRQAALDIAARAIELEAEKGLDLGRSVDAYGDAIAFAAYERAGRRVGPAARLLGVARSTLQQRLRKAGVPPASPGRPRKPAE